MRARIRSIKPDLLTDEDLWDLEQEHPELPILRAFQGLWMYADREGRFEWRPRVLGPLILPMWKGDFLRVLDALATRGFIGKYACGTREYGVVRTFREHQAINNKEPNSELPAPPENLFDADDFTRSEREADACLTRSERDADASFSYSSGLGRGRGREGEGKDALPTRRDSPPHRELVEAWEDLRGAPCPPADNARLRRDEPRVRRLADARGLSPGDLLRRAWARLGADPKARSKQLVTLAILLSQLEQWADEPSTTGRAQCSSAEELQAEQDERDRLEAEEQAHA